MKSTHRLSALALALLLLLPSMTSCGKKGLSIDQDQALEQLAISAAKAEAAKAEAKKQAAAAREEAAAKAAEEAKPKIKEPVEAVPLENADAYSAPAKTAEVYDPAAEHRALTVFGAAASDGEYIAVYGECATGASISIQNENEKL